MGLMLKVSVSIALLSFIMRLVHVTVGFKNLFQFLFNYALFIILPIFGVAVVLSTVSWIAFFIYEKTPWLLEALFSCALIWGAILIWFWNEKSTQQAHAGDASPDGVKED